MLLSLAIEPKKKGIFQPYYWSQAVTSTSSHSSLIPLLFPEPLPTLTLIDRSQLLWGHVDSNASDIQFLRAVQGHLCPDNQRTGDHPDPIRNAIGSISHGGTVIPVFNGDLILVVHNGATQAHIHPLDSQPTSQHQPFPQLNWKFGCDTMHHCFPIKSTVTTSSKSSTAISNLLATLFRCYSLSCPNTAAPHIHHCFPKSTTTNKSIPTFPRPTAAFQIYCRFPPPPPPPLLQNLPNVVDPAGLFRFLEYFLGIYLHF